MPILTANHIRTKNYYSSNNLFSLMVEHHVFKTQIVMKMHSDMVNTRDIPWTFDFLQKNLPTILASTCFNDEHIPFAIEVTRTELGHLFEHILLEYLCQEKLMKGCDEAVFSGKTKWNWEKEPFGLFHIYIKMQSTDVELFPRALENSIALLEKIISPAPAEIYTYSSLPAGKSE